MELKIFKLPRTVNSYVTRYLTAQTVENKKAKSSFVPVTEIGISSSREKFIKIIKIKKSL